jgi:TetR/AcrR family transcriptional repressor of nem operon
VGKRGEQTREKILDSAHEIVMEQGLSTMSLDRVLDNSGLTKGCFFYHFKSKDELIRALMERHARAENAILEETMRRAGQMSRDPLQQLLIAISLLIEDAEGAAEVNPGDPNPGCLFGLYAYELESFLPEIREIIRESAIHWRNILREQFDRIAKEYPPRLDVNLDGLADNLLVTFEGSLILGRMIGDPQQVVVHLHNYRAFLELLFSQRAAGTDTVAA